MASQYRRRSLMLNTIAKVAQGNPTIITDSSSRRLQKLNVYGQSEQASTTGAQLLNLPTGTFTNEEGQSFKVNDDMTVDVNSPVFESGYHDVVINLETPIDVVQGQTNLRLFFDGNISPFASFLLVDDVGASILSIELGTSYTGIANQTGRATKFYYRQQNTGGVTAKGLKFMVSQSSITDYEPYTGGKPSPSPDYPQEIISKEVSEIKVTGKNLANIQEFEAIGISGFEAQYEDDKIVYSGANNWAGCAVVLPQTFEAGQYTIKAKNVAMLVSDVKIVGFSDNVYWENLGYPYVMKNFYSKTEGYAFYSDKPFKIGFIGGTKTDGSTDAEGTMEQIQIELSSEATSYEQHKSQTITLTEPVTLRGVTVASSGNVIIDGQQYISDYIDSVSGKINRLIGFIESYNGENVGDIYMSTTGELSIGATVIYKLDSPTQEDLPKAQEIKALKTFYPNTVIDTGCWNEVTYSAKRGG